MEIRGLCVITGWSTYKSQWCGETLNSNANDVNNAVVAGFAAVNISLTDECRYVNTVAEALICY